jgi:Ca-activated chloride channel family protein
MSAFLSGLRLSSPVLLLALVVPAVIAWRLIATRRRRPTYFASSAELFADLPTTFRERLAGVPVLLRMTALAVAAVALAGPFASGRQVVRDLGDVALVFDVSGSMMAEDLQPTRLGAARAFARRLVESGAPGRFAVVSFAGQAITNCPLTDDRAAVLEAIDEVEYRSADEGTALGGGLAAAARTLLTGDRPGRRIVLFTDGSENGGALQPDAAAAAARTAGVAIDAVGVGSSGRAVPYTTPFGVIDVRLDLDEDALRRLAATGGGTYVRLTGDGTTAPALDLVGTVPDRASGGPITGLVLACVVAAALLLLTELVLRLQILRMDEGV